MSSIILVCGWVIVAKGIAIFPSRDHHWRAAYVLIAVGVPILGWMTYQHGVLWGIFALFAGMWVLRWPVYYAWKWVRRVILKRE